MKRITIIISALLICSGGAFAQDVQKAAEEAAKAMAEAAAKANKKVDNTQFWTKGVDFDLGFNQTGLFNWAAGGYNTLSLAAGIDGKAIYTRDLMSWNNRLQLNYGFLWSADKRNLLQKNTDRIYFESKWAYKTGKSSTWNYTASFDFRSQFTDGYVNYVQEEESNKWKGTLKSGFLSPGYTNIALGMEWNPVSWFNVNIAPLTGGFTICTIDELKKGYGMKPVDPENLDAGYKSLLFQFGAQVKLNFKATINDQINYSTQLVLFTDYLDNPFQHNRVNWDNKISWVANKFIKLSIDTWLVYDPIVTIDGVTSKTQFKEFFAVNFTYSIKSRECLSCWQSAGESTRCTSQTAPRRCFPGKNSPSPTAISACAERSRRAMKRLYAAGARIGKSVCTSRTSIPPGWRRSAESASKWRQGSCATTGSRACASNSGTGEWQWRIMPTTTQRR